MTSVKNQVYAVWWNATIITGFITVVVLPKMMLEVLFVILHWRIHLDGCRNVGSDESLVSVIQFTTNYYESPSHTGLFAPNRCGCKIFDDYITSHEMCIGYPFRNCLYILQETVRLLVIVPLHTPLYCKWVDWLNFQTHWFIYYISMAKRWICQIYTCCEEFICDISRGPTARGIYHK